MALDLWLTPRIEEGADVNEAAELVDGDRDELLLGLGGDSLHFLKPYFDILATETGQQVALYGDAYFSRSTILALRRQLQSAKAAIAQAPSMSEQSRSVIIADISQLLLAVERAEMEHKTLVFLGD